LLWDSSCRHEVYRLLAANLATTADLAVADLIVADIVAGPAEDNGDDDDSRAYSVFNALYWVLRSAPNLATARAAMDVVHHEHPEWEGREYPDLLSWMTGFEGFRSELPISIDRLHALIESDPRAALAALTEIREQEQDRHDVRSASAEDALLATVASHPLDGIAMLTADSGNVEKFHVAVIRGWQRTEITPEFAEAAAEALLATDLTVLGADIASMLVFNSATPEHEAWLRSPKSHGLARAVWNARPDNGDNDGSDSQNGSFLDAAVNSTAGKLVDYWTRVFVQSWRDAGEHWRGLTDSLRSDIDLTLEGGAQDQDVLLARAVYVSRFDAFWLGDRAWCSINLLPLLNWDTSPTAASMWDAFLRRSRWNDQMLDAGLLDQYIAAADRLTTANATSDSADHALPLHLAAITLNSTLDLDSRRWLPRLTTAMADDRRTAWFDAIGRQLRTAPVEEVERQWQRWMQRYMTQRIATIPRRLTSSEASAIAHWLVYLGDSFPEAVTFIEQTAATLDSERFLLRELDDEKVQAHPEAVARFIAHLLRGTSQFYDAGDLQRIVGIVKNSAPPDVVNTIRAESLRLGFTGAAAW
jgi:hypothetical protein